MDTLRVYVYSIILIVFTIATPFCGFGQSVETHAKKDTTLALLIDQQVEQRLLSILSQEPEKRDSILVKDGAAFFSVGEYNFNQWASQIPNRSFRVITHADSLRQILPDRPGIIAIILIEDREK